MPIYTPYTYLVGWSAHNKYYYGVRYAKETNCLYESGCHPDDLWKTYFTSSEIVKKYRKTYGEPDIIQVRRTFDCPIKAQVWEVKVLKRIGIQNEKWINNAIAGRSLITEEVKRKMSLSSRGPKTEQHKKNISKGRIGIVFSEKHIENIRKAATGKKQSELSKRKKAESVSVLKWYNNGKENCRRKTHPGKGWVEGRIKGFKWKKNTLLAEGI